MKIKNKIIVTVLVILVVAIIVTIVVQMNQKAQITTMPVASIPAGTASSE